MTVIFGLLGKARAGKDTVAQTIIEKFGLRDLEVKEEGKFHILKYAFADALKAEVRGQERELCAKYNLPYLGDGKEGFLLQYYGAEYRRKQDPYYWIKKVASKIDVESPTIAIVTDVRYFNEAEWIRSREGVTAKIIRHGYIDPYRSSTHSSETELDNYLADYTLTCEDNNLEELKKDAVVLMEMVIQQFDVVGQFIDSLKDDRRLTIDMK